MRWYVGELLGPIEAGPFRTKAEAKAWVEYHSPGILWVHRWRAGLYEYVTGYADEEDRETYYVGTEDQMRLRGWDTDGATVDCVECLEPVFLLHADFDRRCNSCAY